MPFPLSSLMKSLVRRHRYPFGFCDSEFLNAFCMSECLSMICHPINTVVIYSSFIWMADQGFGALKITAIIYVQIISFDYNVVDVIVGNIVIP